MIHQRNRIGAALAASTVLALVPTTAVAPADPVPVVAPTPAAVQPPAPTNSVVLDTTARSLSLQGVLNARDLGGYRTMDDHEVRTGLIVRSGDLGKATDADLTTLTSDNLRIIDDLRSQPERMMQPDRVPVGAVENSDDILGSMSPQELLGLGSPQQLLGQFAGGQASAGEYREFVTSPGAGRRFADVIHDIIETADGAVLYHCTSGQDRTGWTSAVILTILGVDRSTVTYDYLLSNYYHDNPDTVSMDLLDDAFDQVQQTYGSFANYVHEGLHLTDADIAALRAKMLQ
ncbi:protein-tyrosine-phosphatase [Nocardia sp. ET3-3]|uniref:Protein-tyrosine-phosphatase n=2 Tax=Nocardia terrae TaxID=2675851 RepID=A0A7K1US67_9NOCA|nr:protein-tyrosine-phosphatase [Nocardia terrae]